MCQSNVLAPFLNYEGRLRNGWWILLFLTLLAALLVPLLIVATGFRESAGLWRQWNGAIGMATANSC